MELRGSSSYSNSTSPQSKVQIYYLIPVALSKVGLDADGDKAIFSTAFLQVFVYGSAFDKKLDPILTVVAGR